MKPKPLHMAASVFRGSDEISINFNILSCVFYETVKEKFFTEKVIDECSKPKESTTRDVFHLDTRISFLEI